MNYQIRGRGIMDLAAGLFRLQWIFLRSAPAPDLIIHFLDSIYILSILQAIINGSRDQDGIGYLPDHGIKIDHKSINYKQRI